MKMMSRNIDMIEASEEILTLVTGGNYGDAEKDTGATSMYHVGQEVQKFNTFFHLTTTTTTIKLAVKLPMGVWAYGTDCGLITADDIER